MTRSKSKKEKAAAELQLQARAGNSNARDRDNGNESEKEKEKEKEKESNIPQQPSSSALIICRNKHWRYISSFHGPWLQLPPEVLESLAYSNYSAPRPRPIDPAVFFDLLKIRRHVDEATTLAVRAASGVVSSLPQKDHHLLLGIGSSGPSPRLSRERKHRMRELATQKLARAYKLDEIAASVATMQSASSLEDVAQLVLQREQGNADAEYVHFFHEKIPSRMLAKCTSLTPLDHVIAERPGEGAPLRTRAVTRVFKEDFLGAAGDLTKALGLGSRGGRHDTGVLERGGTMQDEEMPSSLEGQLLFHRACTYLSVAVQNMEKVFSSSSSSSPPTSSSEDRIISKEESEARKAVRTHAKRALRDYGRFLGFFEYTPGDSPDTTTTTPPLLLTDGSSSSSSSTSSTSSRHNRNTKLSIFPISTLFSTPTPILPPPQTQNH
ncbi:hypothetical protein BDD12DRAFT_981442 [Trichophaea hybrida]|nr:hypothetical protein BDD12DRAFT_981442 [Trichophaea hybrida]